MKKIIGIILSGGLFCLSACSSNEEIAEENQVALQINIKGAQTRTIIPGTTLPEQSQLGIFTTTNGLVNAQNTLATYANGQCTLFEPIYLNNIEQDVYAYYPYTERTDMDKMTIESKSQTDYLYGYSANANGKPMKVCNSNPQADLLLKHAMTRLTLHIQKADSNPEDELVLTQAYIVGIPYSGTLNIKTGMISINPGTLDLKLNVADKISMGGILADILVLPEHNANILLKLVVNQKWYTAPLYQTTAPWQSGHQYTYTVEIAANGNMRITEATITPWNDHTQDGIEIGDTNYVEN